MEPDITVRSFVLQGKSYEFAFTVGKLRQLKQTHQVDLMDFSDAPQFRLALSEELLLNVAADALGVPVQEFDAAGPVELLGIRDAFWGALAFFFQTANPQKWTVVKGLMKQTETIAQLTISDNVRRLTGSDSLSPAATSDSSPGTAP